MVLAGLAFAGARSKVTTESGRSGTAASVPAAGGSKINLAYHIDEVVIKTPSAIETYFSQPAKTFTNPQGSTINPLTGSAYIQPVELYPVSSNVASNTKAVSAIEEYEESGSISDALVIAGDDVEARHAVISKWLGVYG